MGAVARAIQSTRGGKGTPWHTGNGTLDLQSGVVQVVYDNAAVAHGRFKPSYDSVIWSDNTTW
eukprot:COSAG05_NODE_22960_length_261_cov_0.635802_1_plen_62_part_10